ncbi:MAG: energy-coupling factor ABC transporter permease [Thermodesulfovibrionales bacterium]|nr:energy-coupling factor ABC transporter permease [Thermodesulfovibrionales bacterium]
MADALLSPAVGAGFWAGTLGAITYCSKKLKENTDEKIIPLMGVLGAFIFAAQMINFTIPGTGSSGHIGGGMLLSILLGHYAAFLVIASVLTIQALFFADGGLLALGSNIWNIGIYPCFIAYPLIYRTVVNSNKTSRTIIIASVLSVIAALELGAFSVALQTKLSGITELPFGTFLIVMLTIHLPIGIVEGIITAGVVNYIKTIRPDIIEGAGEVRPLSGGISFKKIVISFAALAVLTGGVFSLIASSRPDGLEWSIEQIYGKAELPDKRNPITKKLSEIQKRIAIMPDYNFPAKDKPAAGESASGLLGGIMVLVLIFFMGMVIKIIKKGRQKP